MQREIKPAESEEGGAVAPVGVGAGPVTPEGVTGPRQFLGTSFGILWLVDAFSLLPELVHPLTEETGRFLVSRCCAFLLEACGFVGAFPTA